MAGRQLVIYSREVRQEEAVEVEDQRRLWLGRKQGRGSCRRRGPEKTATGRREEERMREDGRRVEI